MILDGYTQILVLGDSWIEYRPMLQSERRIILQHASGLRGQSRIDFLNDHLVRHAVSSVPIDSLEKESWKVAFERIIGRGNAAQERIDERNLYAGTRLRILYPHIRPGTCEHCREWWFDPESGKTHFQEGRPLKREIKDEPLNCETDVGCPVGHYKKRNTFSEKNEFAFSHYLHCMAVGEWPDDPIVKRNAYIIGLAFRRFQTQINERARLAEWRTGATHQRHTVR